MKLYLNLLFILCFSIFSAQNKKSDSTIVSEIKNKDVVSETKVKSQDHKEALSEIKSGTEKTAVAQNIDIVQEIKAVLNYKVNRVWRRDLYCFACENYDAGKVA